MKSFLIKFCLFLQVFLLTQLYLLPLMIDNEAIPLWGNILIVSFTIVGSMALIEYLQKKIRKKSMFSR